MTINYKQYAKKLMAINKIINKNYEKSKDKEKFSEEWENKADEFIEKSGYDKMITRAISDGNYYSAQELEELANKNYYANGTERNFIYDSINDWGKIAIKIK